MHYSLTAPPPTIPSNCWLPAFALSHSLTQSCNGLQRNGLPRFSATVDALDALTHRGNHAILAAITQCSRHATACGAHGITASSSTINAAMLVVLPKLLFAVLHAAAPEARSAARSLALLRRQLGRHGLLPMQASVAAVLGCPRQPMPRLGRLVSTDD